MNDDESSSMEIMGADVSRLGIRFRRLFTPSALLILAPPIGLGFGVVSTSGVVGAIREFAIKLGLPGGVGSEPSGVPIVDKSLLQNSAGEADQLR